MSIGVETQSLKTVEGSVRDLKQKLKLDLQSNFWFFCLENNSYEFEICC